MRTLDGGKSTEYVDSFDVGVAHFLSPFRMDPQDANHLVAAGTKVAETLDASTDATWTTVFDLGINDATGGAFQSRGALDVQGDAVYVGACAPCNITATGGQFQNRLATNVGGDKPPQKGTADGWHVASANGLPNRYIYDIEADPANPETVYVVLGGYSTARWLPDGQYLDTNANRGSGRVFKSTDAGESFVDISGDLPDVITTAIVRRGNQLIVGTDIGVFISSDLAGSAWAPLGDLPAVPVNQLVLKPGDDRTLFAGTFGRGVQTYDFAKASDGGSGGGGGTPDAGRFGGGALPAASLFALLAALDDEACTRHLCEIKGVGRWTAQMFLMFCLRRPDVWPVDDIGVQRGISRQFFEGEPIGPKEALQFGEKLKPWRTVAAWYLWRSLDPVVVDY